MHTNKNRIKYRIIKKRIYLLHICFYRCTASAKFSVYTEFDYDLRQSGCAESRFYRRSAAIIAVKRSALQTWRHIFDEFFVSENSLETCRIFIFPNFAV
jgi:hypothetical protein